MLEDEKKPGGWVPPGFFLLCGCVWVLAGPDCVVRCAWASPGSVRCDPACASPGGTGCRLLRVSCPALDFWRGSAPAPAGMRVPSGTKRRAFLCYPYAPTPARDNGPGRITAGCGSSFCTKDSDFTRCRAYHKRGRAYHFRAAAVPPAVFLWFLVLHLPQFLFLFRPSDFPIRLFRSVPLVR